MYLTFPKLLGGFGAKVRRTLSQTRQTSMTLDSYRNHRGQKSQTPTTFEPGHFDARAALGYRWPLAEGFGLLRFGESRDGKEQRWGLIETFNTVNFRDGELC